MNILDLLKDRLKWLRKSLSLTQQELADKLKISRSNIAGYEVGKSEPADAVISLICREFNISEDWLRKGIEPIFVESKIFNLDDYAKERGASDFDIKLLKAYLGLDKEVRDAIIEQFKKEFASQEGIFKKITVEEMRESYAAAPDDPVELKILAKNNKNAI